MQGIQKTDMVMHRCTCLDGIKRDVEASPWKTVKIGHLFTWGSCHYNYTKVNDTHGYHHDWPDYKALQDPDVYGYLDLGPPLQP